MRTENKIQLIEFPEEVIKELKKPLKELKRLNKVDLEFKDMWSLIEEKG